MAKPPTRSVTLSDVANKAGFSRSTASLVFQDNPVVADSTREKVLAAAKELGYVYNRRAAAMRQSRTNSVGVVVGGFANPFFAILTESIEETLSPAGYSVLLGNTRDDSRRQERLISTLLENRVDGLVVVPAVGSDATSFESPVRLGVPLVTLTRFVPGASAPYFGIHDYQASRSAAEHLIKHGVRSVGYFGGPVDVFTRIDRERAVSDVAKENSVTYDPLWSAHTPTSSTGGYVEAMRLLETGPPPEGLVFHSDAIAMGAMRAFHEHGLSIGGSVKVIGFDDVEAAPYTVPSLTSVSVEADEMGRRASHLLISMMNSGTNGRSFKKLFEGHLVIRESCGNHEKFDG